MLRRVEKASSVAQTSKATPVWDLPMALLPVLKDVTSESDLRNLNNLKLDRPYQCYSTLQCALPCMKAWA